MSKSIYRFFQCMIILGLAIYLAEKWISGRLSYYISQRFAIFTLIGIFGLAIMVVVGLLPFFTGTQVNSSQPGEPDPKPGKRKSNFAILLLIPIIVAMLGLSMQLIVTMYILVFIVGLTRLNQSNQNDHDGHADHENHVGHTDHNQPSEMPGNALIILAIPLILGILVPVHPLSTSSLNTRGMSLSAPVSIGQQSIKTMEIAPDDRTVLDWIKIFNYEKDLSSYLGKSANVIGFVYHDPRLKTGQFMLGRFAITCCVADAFAIGMAIDWPDSTNLVDNSWVNVKGTVDVLTIDGQKVPVIHAQAVNPIQAPEQPYLYP